MERKNVDIKLLFQSYIHDKNQNILTIFMCIIEQDDIPPKDFVTYLYGLLDDLYFWLRVFWVGVRNNCYYLTVCLGRECENLIIEEVNPLVVLAHYIHMNGWKFRLCTWGVEDYSNPLENILYYKYLDLRQLPYFDIDTQEHSFYFNLDFAKWLGFLSQKDTDNYIYEFRLYHDLSGIGCNVLIWRPYLLRLLERRDFKYFNIHLTSVEKREVADVYYEHLNFCQKHFDYVRFRRYWLYKQISRKESPLIVNLQIYVSEISIITMLYQCTLVILNLDLSAIKIFDLYRIVTEDLQQMPGLLHLIVYKEQSDVLSTGMMLIDNSMMDETLQKLKNVGGIRFENLHTVEESEVKNRTAVPVIINSLLFSIYTRKPDLAVYIYKIFQHNFELTYELVDYMNYFIHFNKEPKPEDSCHDDFIFLKDYNHTDFTFIPKPQSVDLVCREEK